MPELPEITILARQMQAELVGRAFSNVEVLQPKCLNVAPEEFEAALSGVRIGAVAPRGKWVRVETARGWLLLCLGMGGEVLLTDRSHLPEKYRLIFDLTDGECVAVNFWWLSFQSTTCRYPTYNSRTRGTPHFPPKALPARPTSLSPAV